MTYLEHLSQKTGLSPAQINSMIADDENMRDLFGQAAKAHGSEPKDGRQYARRVGCSFLQLQAKENGR